MLLYESEVPGNVKNANLIMSCKINNANVCVSNKMKMEDVDLRVSVLELFLLEKKIGIRYWMTDEASV